MTSAATAPIAPSSPRRKSSRGVRTGEVVAWFAGVVCAYWIYWLIAVPLIEPGLEPQVAGRASDGDVARARESKSARKEALAQYFPPGSWELENPAIWETDQTLLLFKEPTPTGGDVVLKHCTMLFFPRDGAALTEPRPIIMRAPDGATLRFDEPIVFETVDFGKRRLVGGKLKGPITIERKPSRPDAGDDLLITTHDIELAGNRAFTPHSDPVKFRLGRSHGSGRDLEILLGEPDARPGGGFRTGKVRTLLLKHDVVMNLAPDDPALSRGRPPGRQPSDLANSTVKITCQGAFQYDFGRSAASFQDRVDVVRSSVGPNDLLNCELLTVFFEQRGVKPSNDAPPESAPRPGDANKARADLPIRRIEARGIPVTLRSEARGIYIQCRGLDFAPIPGDPFGRIVGIGPGVMEGVAPGVPPSRYQVQWTREFRFEPAENGQYVASLQGGATVRVPNMGEITAHDRLDAEGHMIELGRIFAWVTPINEPPPAEPLATIRPVSIQTAAGRATAAPQADRPPGTGDEAASPTSPGKWQIERVLAQGNVVVDVPQLDAKTGRLEIWIERPSASGVVSPPGQSSDALRPGGNVAPPGNRGGAPAQATPTQRFSVQAGGVQAKLVPNGEQYAVASLTLDNEAYLQELTPRPGTRPMIVAGDRLHVTSANNPQTRVTVVGQPAKVEAGGLTLLGETIDLERHTNRLWVAGAGRMITALEQDLDGKRLARPQEATITWQRSMNFETNAALFQGSVRVTSQSQTLSTEKLEAILDRAIDFANPRAGAPPAGGSQRSDAPQLAFVRCYGEAVLDGTTIDEAGQKTASDEMHVSDLTINRANGDVEARGPGWVRHVGSGNNDGMLVRGASRGPAGAQQKPAAPRPGLTYLHVQFQRAMRGNLNRREMTFGEPTKTVYAPVADWNARLDAEKPASLGPEGMVLDAKQLTVREMPARDKAGRGWFELVAVGNVLAEGTQFVALGNRATYSQDKDQLVLEGDGRSPAQLSYTAIAGGPRREARVDKIIYSIGLQHVIFSGAHSLGVEVLQPQGKPDEKQGQSINVR